MYKHHSSHFPFSCSLFSSLLPNTLGRQCCSCSPLPTAWDGLQVSGKTGGPRWRMLFIQSSFAGRCTEVKVIAAVVPQGAQEAEQGPLQRDMLGSVGVQRGAWGKECRGNTTRLRALGSGFGRQLCLLDFLFHLLLPPQGSFSLLQQRYCSWITAGSFHSLLMRNSCTLSLETEPRLPRDCGEGLQLRLQGEREAKG